MKKIITLSILMLLFLVSCKTETAKVEKNEVDYAITNVTLIDGTGKEAKSNVNILIKEERILKITSDSVGIEADSIIDGTGKYVIPGLFDNHIHLGYDEKRYPKKMQQLIHFGVTTILVPGGSNQKLLKFKSDIKEHNYTAPNIYHTSLMTTMEGKHPAKTYGSDYYTDKENINYIKSDSSIDSIVDQAVKDQAIAVKLMIEDGPEPPFVDRIPETYIAQISKKAHAVGLEFFAHVSDMEEARLAINNEADALMHFVGVQIDWEKDADIVQKLIDKKISWVSTAMIAKSFFYMVNKQWFENEHYNVYDSYLTDDFKDPDGSKEAEARAMLKGFMGTDEVSMEMAVAPMMKDLKKLYDQNANIVVGTDVGGKPFIFTGFSVHEEMELFQLGGFTTEQIIKCTTLNAAKMLKIDADYGSVEIGKYADLVLLNNNPIEDIKNTLSINTVFKGGKIQKRITNTK